ncbi:MAG: cell division protein FtsA [Tannerella sp.]|jgi:cell division protein FtsA|nr:cell division protein FtsA [Tannerella sp.]
MTDYIVAIDLGTSHITGIVGKKVEGGKFEIVATEVAASDSCILRGNVHNTKSTGDAVARIVDKLENHLAGDHIDRVYVGLGGQFLRTVEHVETKEIEDGATVLDADMDALRRQCEQYKPDDVSLDVIDVVSPVYYVDGNRDNNPEGVSCKRLEARYKLIVGPSSLRRNINMSIKDHARKEVAGIIITPLALADAVLSKQDKDLGCALIDFGAGVTSVTIYKDGILKNLSIIPFGGNLITRDITTVLNLTEDTAEKVKIEYGSAILKKDEEDKMIELDSVESKISLNNLNVIIEGRVREIIGNVIARINDAVDIKLLGAGIIIAGGVSELAGLDELLKDKSKKVRFSTVRAELIQGSEDMLGNPVYMQAIALMLKGTKQCVYAPPVADVTEEVITTPEEPKPTSSGWGPFKKKKKLGQSKDDSDRVRDGGRNSGAGSLIGRLFDEE